MSSHQLGGNGHSRTPVDILDVNFRPLGEMSPPPPARPKKLWLALWLFFLTLISTLAVGSEFAASYAQNREPFSDGTDPFKAMIVPFEHPQLLTLGVPFSFTLLGILLAHELGHYFTCRYYGIQATYPYFIPAPTLIGTLGAFIRIKSPIANRRQLFDIGISGPLAGFALAIPALIGAIFLTRGAMPATTPESISLGNPLAVILLTKLFRSSIHPGQI